MKRYRLERESQGEHPILLESAVRANLGASGMVLARAAITRVLAHALKRKKPAPDQIWHILDSLRKDFASALVVGDTAIDQEVAAAASVPFVHARYGYGDLQRPASLWIESLNELEEVALEPAAVSCCMSE